MTPLLQVERLSVGFRRYDGLVRQAEIGVLDGLSFELGRGEVLAIVGASGAGKSLLAHAIFGILPPNAVRTGTLRLGGTTIDAGSQAALCGRRMALMPQSVSHLDPLVRCRRQLAWAARRSGANGDAARRAGAALQRFGLDASAGEAFPHQLSGGMARRMMLAIATIGDPELVVADEPTSGLDPVHAGVVLRDLRGLADAGKAVMLITHDLADALAFADRVALMRGGRLAGIERAGAFREAGDDLRLPYARELWRALPQNGFLEPEAAAHA